MKKNRDIICHSGGAVGSDNYWGKKTLEYGGKVNHYYLSGFKTPYGNKEMFLESDGIESIDKLLTIVNEKYLHRKYPTSKAYVNNLLRRNYFQAKNSDTIYAISGMGEDGIVLGGTAWAVYMGIELGKKVYVLDQVLDEWYEWDYSVGTFLHYLPSVLSDNFAGIGTRNINDSAKKRIDELFELTFDL